MFLFSFIIFFLIIATGILNIIIYLYLKENISSFFNLIEKSDKLYKNILFLASLVKELLITSFPIYTNILINNKPLYYKSITKRIQNYYIDNTYILSNLTNNFNILSKKDEETITNKQVEISIISPTRTTKEGIVSKTYTALIYSAYRELNSALYHISQLSIDEIYHYNYDVIYFLKNGKTDLLVNSDSQMLMLNDLMAEKIKSGQKTIIICIIAIIFVYGFCMWLFSYFYKKLTIKRNNYLLIFKDLEHNLIISCLQKCEKLSKKLEEKKENNDLKKRKVTSNSSSVNDSEIENNNFRFINESKIREEKILKERKDKNENKKNKIKNYIFQIILFLIFLAWQIGIYVYYYDKMSLYGKIATYEYYISKFASNFLLIFIGVREYAFGKKVMFFNQPSGEFLEDNLINFYVKFSETSKMKDIYRKYFSDSYQDFLNYLYNEKVCEFIDAYNKNYPNAKTDCSKFFYGSPKFGFMTLLGSFVEELRILKDRIDYYYKIADEKHFGYNESLFNDPYGLHEELYKKYENNLNEYKKYNPINIFQTGSHKQLLITYLYINTKVYDSLINKSLEEFYVIFKKYNSINLILNIIFISALTLGFIFIWIPFILYINKNLGKIKNMIYIIPSELLLNIHNINNLREIE